MPRYTPMSWLITGSIRRLFMITRGEKYCQHITYPLKPQKPLMNPNQNRQMTRLSGRKMPNSPSLEILKRASSYTTARTLNMRLWKIVCTTKTSMMFTLRSLSLLLKYQNSAPGILANRLRALTMGLISQPTRFASGSKMSRRVATITRQQLMSSSLLTNLQSMKVKIVVSTPCKLVSAYACDQTVFKNAH